MNTKRLILITPGFTADVHDRNCLPTLQLYAEALHAENIEVHVVSLDYPFSDKAYPWKGVTVHPCGGRNSRWLKPRTIWRALNICSRLVTETPERYNVALHSFWLGWASGIGEHVAKQHGVPHITTLMGQDVLPQNRHRFRFLTRERQTRLVALSSFQNEVLAQNSGFRAAHVIPWGASGAEIPDKFPQNRPIDILGVGSLIPLKNWDLWLETISIISKTRPQLRAMLLGDGQDRQRLEHKARHLGLAQTVEFSGECSRPQVLEKMQQARVLLHTSNFESQGYVLSEAAMNACRIVGTPVGIAAEMGPVADTAEALAVLVQEALEAPILAEAVTPYLMSDTVRAYLKLT
jgi:1,2-diacylglycerol 3-alpha-glucosyltransferase